MHRGRSLDGRAEAQFRSRDIEDAHLAIDTAAVDFQIVAHARGTEVSVGSFEIVREILRVNRFFHDIDIAFHVQGNHSEVEAEVELVGEIHAQVQDHVDPVAAGLAAPALVQRTSRADLAVVKDPFGGRDIGIVRAVLVVDHAGTPADHLIPVNIRVVIRILFENGRRNAFQSGRHLAQIRGIRIGSESGDLVQVVGRRVADETERDTLESGTLAQVGVDVDTEVRQCETGPVTLQRTREIDVGCAVLRPGRDDADVRGDGHLGIAGNCGAGRVDADGSQVAAQGGEGIAHRNGTGRAVIVILAELEGVADGLCTGGQRRESQEGCNCYLFHGHVVFD